MRIYTRGGDQGETGLFGGQRVSKSHPRVAALGEVDELNALLGVCGAACDDEELGEVLREIQVELFVLGADLATPEETDGGAARRARRVRESGPARLETLIDRFEERLPPLQTFILPGGCPLAAHLHHARTVCRRAERAVVAASGKETLNPDVQVYLNRLSDLLFVLARLANQAAGVEEEPWMPGSS